LCRACLLVASHLHGRSPDTPLFSKPAARNRILQLIVSFDGNQLNFENAVSPSTHFRESHPANPIAFAPNFLT